MVEQKKGSGALAPGGWTTLCPIRYGPSPVFEICPGCAKQLGLPEAAREREKAIADRLLEILEEIAQTQVEECPGCP